MNPLLFKTSWAKLLLLTGPRTAGEKLGLMILLTGVRVVVLDLLGTTGVPVFKINVFSTLVEVPVNVLGDLRIFFLFAHIVKISNHKLDRQLLGLLEVAASLHTELIIMIEHHILYICIASL